MSAAVSCFRKDRWGLTAFPSFQILHATFTAHGFPYSLLLFFWLSSDTLMSTAQPVACAPRCVGEHELTTPGVFRSQSLFEAIAFLADLHLVRAITARHLIPTLPPPSVLHAGIFAPYDEVQQLQSSPVPLGSVLATRRCLLYAGCLLGEPSSSDEEDEASHLYHLVKCLNRFHLSQVTTLQSQVPLVNIGRRGSSILLWSVPNVRYIVRGLRTSSSAAAQRTPLPPYIVIQMFPCGQHLRPLKGSLILLEYILFQPLPASKLLGPV